jgi:AraC-like DNA-binding protein
MEQTANPEFPFVVPFIRWADYSAFLPGQAKPLLRQLYDHEFVYVISGHGTIALADNTYTAQPDSLFLVQPRIWHSYRAAPNEPMVLLGVHFDWVPRRDTLSFPVSLAAQEPVEQSRYREPCEVPEWDLATMPFLDLKGRPRVRHLLEDVVTAHGREDDESRTEAGALLAAATAQMAREVKLLRQLARYAVLGPDAVRRIEHARSLLEAATDADDAAPLTIEQIAAQVGWGADHLRRVFRTALDTSPLRVQTAARMRRARELLRNEAMPIHEVARRCGFDDPSHFTRVFRKESGLSPRQYQVLAHKW